MSQVVALPLAARLWIRIQRLWPSAYVCRTEFQQQIQYEVMPAYDLFTDPGHDQNLMIARICCLCSIASFAGVCPLQFGDRFPDQTPDRTFGHPAEAGLVQQFLGLMHQRADFKPKTCSALPDNIFAMLGRPPDLCIGWFALRGGCVAH